MPVLEKGKGPSSGWLVSLTKSLNANLRTCLSWSAAHTTKYDWSCNMPQHTHMHENYLPLSSHSDLLRASNILWNIVLLPNRNKIKQNLHLFVLETLKKNSMLNGVGRMKIWSNFTVTYIFERNHTKTSYAIKG